MSGNDAFLALIDVPAHMREPRINLARVFLHPDGLGRRVINMDEWGRHVIEGLRRKALRQPNPALDDLIEELEPYAPPRSPDPSPLHVGFAVPLRLRTERGELTLLTTLTHFATAVDVTISELTLEAFLPADAATASHFEAPDVGPGSAGLGMAMPLR